MSSRNVLSWSDFIYEKAQIHSNKRTNEQEVPTNKQYEILWYETFLLILCNERCSSTYFCLIGSWCSGPDLHWNRIINSIRKQKAQSKTLKEFLENFPHFWGLKILCNSYIKIHECYTIVKMKQLFDDPALSRVSPTRGRTGHVPNAFVWDGA